MTSSAPKWPGAAAAAGPNAWPPPGRATFSEAGGSFATSIAAELFRIGEEARLHDGKFPGQNKPDYSADRMLELCASLIRGVVDKPRLDQLSIIAESHRLREQRPEDIVRIRMTIGEDGMEWQTIERDDGTVERKLLPE